MKAEECLSGKMAKQEIGFGVVGEIFKAASCLMKLFWSFFGLVGFYMVKIIRINMELPKEGVVYKLMLNAANRLKESFEPLWWFMYQFDILMIILFCISIIFFLL